MSEADDYPEGSILHTVLLARRKSKRKSGPGRKWNAHSTSQCGVVGCSSCTRSCPNLWFFRLPSYTIDGPRRNQWLAKIRRIETKFIHCLLVCELHFKPKDIMKTKNGKKLRSNAVPSLFLPARRSPDYQSPGIRSSKPKYVYQRINNETKLCNQTDLPCIEGPSITTHEASKVNDNNVNTNDSNSEEDKKSHEPSVFKALALIETQKLDDLDEFKLRMFKLYYSNAQAYQVLQTILGLPPVSSLPSFIPPTPTAVNEIYMDNLKAQVSHMSRIQKYCVLCVALTRIKPSVGYDYSSDTAFGVCGRVNVVPAQYAVIAMARGIILNWHYIASITLIGTLEMYQVYNNWLNGLVHDMELIGYSIKAILTGTENFFVNAFALRKMSMKHLANYKKNAHLYHIFDPRHLMLLLYEELKNNCFTFTEQGQKKSGNWNYITQFYEIDSKRTFRLTNNTSVVNPDDLQQNQLKSVVQILSMSTATGISIFMDLNIFNEKARDTLDFIVRINKIFAALYPDSIPPECKYRQESKFWQESMQFLRSVEIPSIDGSVCEFIKYFCTSMHSIKLIRSEFVSKNLPLTHNLNQDPLMDFIHKINSMVFTHRYPDLKEFFEVIVVDLMNNTIKPEINGTNTDDFIEKAKTIKENCSEDFRKKITKRDYDENYDNSYTQIEDCDADSLLYVATYLLEKMCQKYRNSVTSRLTLMNSSVYYEKKLSVEFRGSVIVPDNDFLQLVYDMDTVFVDNCRSAMVNGCWHETLMKQMSKSIAAVPVDLVSLKYITGLFIDLRIYHSIKYNNQVYKKDNKEGQQFVVRKLNSIGLNLT